MAVVSGSDDFNILSKNIFDTCTNGKYLHIRTDIFIKNYIYS